MDLVILGTSLVIPIVFTTYNPFPFQVEAAKNAKIRGWNNFTILITRTCPYLTLYSQIWTILAIYSLNPTIMFVAQSMTIIVFCLYHGINLIDPTNLTYHPVEFVKEVISWKPPNNWNIIIWAGLHVQHTVFPFYLYYLTIKYEINYTNDIRIVLTSYLAMIVYIIWHTFCWIVQGIPAYPFMTKLKRAGHDVIFYIVGLNFMIIVNCIISRMWNELFFFFLGAQMLSSPFNLLQSLYNLLSLHTTQKIRSKDSIK